MAEEVRTVDDDAKPDEGPNWMSDEEVKTAATELNAALSRTQRGEHEGCPSSRRGLSPGRCGPVPYTRSSIQSMTPTTPTIISGIAKILAPASAPRPYAPARGGVECLVVA